MYFCIIAIFILGPVIGNIRAVNFGGKAIMASSFILFVTFVIMLSGGEN